MPVEVKDGQAQIVLVGCGAPNRGMGWYHAEQMLRGDIPSAALAYIVEPWFLGAGRFFRRAIAVRCIRCKGEGGKGGCKGE